MKKLIYLLILVSYSVFAQNGVITNKKGAKINTDSLIAKQVIINTPNAITESNEKSATGTWTLGAGWSGNATNGFNYTELNGYSLLTNSYGFIAGRKYKITIDRQDDSGGNTIFLLIGSFYEEENDGQGWIQDYYVTIPSNSDDDNLSVRVSDESSSHTNIKIKIVEVIDSKASLIINNSTTGYPTFEIRNPSGEENTVIGLNSGKNLAPLASNNTIYGATNMSNATNSSSVTSIGNSVMTQGGDNSVMIGTSVANYNKPSFSIGIGTNVYNNSTLSTISNSIGIGRNTNNGSNNIDNITIGSNSSSNNSSVTIGHASGNVSSTGFNNYIIGYQAGNTLTTGENNILMGYQTGLNNTTGSSNVFIGNSISTFTNVTNNNTVVGHNSFKYHTTGDNNVVIGNNSANVISGIGSTASYSNNSIYIGNNIGTGSVDNEIIIGTNAKPSGANSAVLGNDATIKVVLGGTSANTNVFTNGKMSVGYATAGQGGSNDVKLTVGGSTAIDGRMSIGRVTSNQIPAGALNTAIIQINGTDGGLLLSRLTTTQINALSSPPAGLVVYNTTLNMLCYYNGTVWQRVTSSDM